MGLRETLTGFGQQFMETVRQPRSPVPDAPLTADEQAVFSALENPGFLFKSEVDIAAGTGLDSYDAYVIVTTSPPLNKLVIRSSSVDQQGHDLFTTRRFYDQNAGLGRRILSTLSDRIR